MIFMAEINEDVNMHAKKPFKRLCRSYPQQMQQLAGPKPVRVAAPGTELPQASEVMNFCEAHRHQQDFQSELWVKCCGNCS